LYPREIDPETTRILGTFPGTQLTAPIHAAFGSPFGRGPSRFAHILGGEVVGGTLGAALGGGAGYGLGRLIDMARGEDSGLFADNMGQKLLGGAGLIIGGLGGSGLGAMYGHRRSMEGD
jgi:hypothetical protein